MTRFHNLTAEPLTLCLRGGDVLRLKAAPDPVRVAHPVLDLDTRSADLDLVVTGPAEIENLPPPRPDTLFVVPYAVLSYCAGRRDVAAVHPSHRGRGVTRLVLAPAR